MKNPSLKWNYIFTQTQAQPCADSILFGLFLCSTLSLPTPAIIVGLKWTIQPHMFSAVGVREPIIVIMLPSSTSWIVLYLLLDPTESRTIQVWTDQTVKDGIEWPNDPTKGFNLRYNTFRLVSRIMSWVGLTAAQLPQQQKNELSPNTHN